MPHHNIFGPKPKTKDFRFQGYLTEEGVRLFERARERAARVARHDNVSDGDTVEFVLRGVKNTRRYLRRRTA